MLTFSPAQPGDHILRAINPETGEILGWVGHIDHETETTYYAGDWATRNDDDGVCHSFTSLDAAKNWAIANLVAS